MHWVGQVIVKLLLNIYKSLDKQWAASVGVDVLNLVKSMQEVQGQEQQEMQKAQQLELTKQQGQFASAPINDPSKNPKLLESNDPEQREIDAAQGNEEAAAI
mgnify:CR=1 FL=1